jgi:hypothetical protein
MTKDALRLGRQYKSGIHLLLPRAVNAFSTAGIVAAGGGVLNISFGISC